MAGKSKQPAPETACFPPRGRRLLCAAFALMLCSLAAAGPAIALAPEGGEAIELYPFEIADYVLRVANPDANAISDLVLTVLVGDELAIVSSGAEAREAKFFFAEIPPGAFATKELRVKALQAGTRLPSITVSYGSDTYSHKVAVRKNPVTIDAGLSKPSLNPGEAGSVVFNISNTGNRVLKDIRAEIIVPDDISDASEPFSLNSLEPNQSYINKEFPFSPDAEILGKRNIVLRISYSDGERVRLFERSFVVEIQQRSQYLFIIIGIIAVLVVLSYVLRQQRIMRKPGEGIEIKEIRAPGVAEPKKKQGTKE